MSIEVLRKQTENAAIALEKAAASLTTVLQGFSGDKLGLVKLIEEISTKQVELEAVTKEVDEKKRMAFANLEIAILENKLKTVESILKETGLTSINIDELNTLRVDFKKLKESFDEEVKKAKHEAISAAQKEAKQQIDIKELEFKAQQAENVAKIQRLEEQLKTAQAAAEDYKEQLTAERDARVQIAAHTNAPTINVGGNGR